MAADSEAVPPVAVEPVVSEGVTYLGKRLLRLTIYLMMIVMGLSTLMTAQAADMSKSLVAVIPVKGEIEPGLAAFVERSIKDAEEQGAAKVILELNTPGGLIDSAHKIKNTVSGAEIPVVVFVDEEAKSAGVLIALAADKIYMSPGSSIGAAEPIPNTEKILASWKSDLEAAAEAKGRNPEIVAGMADKRVVIPGVKKEGEILSLTAQQAVNLKLADRIVQGKQDLISLLSEQDKVTYQVRDIQPGWGEKLGWWVTNPFISPILLLIGFAGLIIEAFTVSWGVAGTLGIVALGTYFAGHIMSGVTGIFALVVFCLGIVALLLEIFVIPGFGAAGIAGICLLVWSICLASVSLTQAVISLSVALIGSIVLVYVLVKVLGLRGVWDRMILGLKMDKQSGYVAPAVKLEQYLNREGETISPLRPAGTALFGNDRVDVVTEGGFIPAQARVKVVLVEGTRVVVRQLD